jgi:hypothetical protein
MVLIDGEVLRLAVGRRGGGEDDPLDPRAQAALRMLRVPVMLLTEYFSGTSIERRRP